MDKENELLIFSLPDIKGVTFTRGGITFLRKDILFDYSDIGGNNLNSILPGAILYAVTGVIKMVELRKIPVPVSGRTVYPVSSQLVPELHSRLVINEQSKKIRYQGDFFSPGYRPHPRGARLLGIAFELMFNPGTPEQW
ncbi:hypothetical protein [Citrobacter youngae]|uniref:Uncharacterized protein n=1 Tax=Citrobacter youngae ATCC 29220 TaxID=500640 RepID=D4BAW9_9ENTR|nr:hypothetical protein [Citrobacter youngae]EFE09330.1 hypothetical protein CIT292_07615 [Citrobacter youngae ATCC 29220]